MVDFGFSWRKGTIALAIDTPQTELDRDIFVSSTGLNEYPDMGK